MTDEPDSFELYESHSITPCNMNLPASHGSGDDATNAIVDVGDDPMEGRLNTLVVLPEGATKADAIYILSKNIPHNEFKLPNFFYRSDLLPFSLQGLTQEACDVAVVWLDFSEGYPTFNGGHIFWQQLPSEPYDAFLLFQRYLDQAEEVGLRQLQLFASENNVKSERIYQLAKEYYWQERARAYDLFQVAAERKRREIRIRKAEGRHYAMAERFMGLIQQKFEVGTEQLENLLKEMSPDKAVDLLIKLAELQRLSLGLSKTGNQERQMDIAAIQTGADLMRDITQRSGQQDAGVGLTDSLAELLKDPHFAMRAQAVVLEVRHQDSGVEAISDMRHVGSSSAADQERIQAGRLRAQGEGYGSASAGEGMEIGPHPDDEAQKKRTEEIKNALAVEEENARRAASPKNTRQGQTNENHNYVAGRMGNPLNKPKPKLDKPPT